MQPRPAPWTALLALLAPSACIEHHNELGSLDVGGSVLNLGGASGTAGDGGGGRSASALRAVCQGNATTLSLSRTCQSDDECCPLQDSSVVSLEGAASGDCVTGVLAIRCGEMARFNSFFSLCPMAVGTCSPSRSMIATEDGRSAAYTTTPAARCETGVCRSYLP